MSNFKGLKSHPIHNFKQKKTFHVKKQSLSFQNMLSKLWATYEMSFWERKIHGAFKCNLTFLTWQIRGSARHKSILQAEVFQPKYIQFKQSQVPQWCIDASYMLCGTFHTILSALNEELLSWPSGALFELASPIKTFGSSSDHETTKFSKSTPNIYPF